MSLKCFVKVGSINNLSDARYCSGMNVDHVGFLMEENNINSIDITNLREISNWISGVKIVGEFNNSSIKFINSKLNQVLNSLYVLFIFSEILIRQFKLFFS